MIASDISEPDVELNLGALLEANKHLQVDRDEYNINVTSNSGEGVSVEECKRAIANFDGAGKRAHLYFHLPLCNYICHFCNYVKRLIPRGKEDGLFAVRGERPAVIGVHAADLAALVSRIRVR
ncbi:hypothetical protein LP422_21755 [Janibacter limosus]|uniref:hypothetical protein n=1 Tax=Janibacter limosus TaxID=53458 RepID=UPI0035DAD12F|nr:hypothetical protein LP422_21755 [Janibacter limosus]